MQEKVHPRVKKYLDECGEEERLKEGLARLGEDLFTSRSGLDLKKLKGKTHDVHSPRIGEHRFEYFAEDGIVWIQNAFRRERGYIEGRKFQDVRSKMPVLPGRGMLMRVTDSVRSNSLSIIFRPCHGNNLVIPKRSTKYVRT
jgi:hypothetical protein